ncbi:GDSL esterase/lipase At2g38180 isoform X2 [Capsicum annuum]|uniref:GDSL esterase/lipase At2g38180 isoform X2 n=1 Tax=Capsicum annuum TaxID=4072 RepID=UPI0007BEEAF7|nr:GDSL esterase/lipase At2g38180 isoform X2 [Capsicum annuum]
MIGPSRPLFVLFGSSIVQFSYLLHGWGATLTGLYARKADISLRGYAGWNSRMAIQILDKVFPKSLSETTRLIMLSAPAVNEEQIVQFYGSNLGRTNERGRIYSEAGIKLGQELGVKVIDFWSALQERPDWLTTVFWDGMHLTKEGSDIVVRKILKALREAEWKPSLHWKKMSDEFSDIIITLNGADGIILDDWQKEYE